MPRIVHTLEAWAVLQHVRKRDWPTRGGAVTAQLFLQPQYYEFVPLTPEGLLNCSLVKASPERKKRPAVEDKRRCPFFFPRRSHSCKRSLHEAWKQLQGSVSIGQNLEVVSLAVYMLLGGVCALYVRFLFRRCSSSPSDSDSITRVFPLLTLVTIGVIAIVKSSLALSLGLVGSLSIIRFRAAIKEPEELVYLFLCIGVGLAFGAGQPLLAVVLLGIATIFILGMFATHRGKRHQNLLLTITGTSEEHFGGDGSGVLSAIDELADRYSLQRFDLTQDRGQVRIVLPRTGGRETTALITRLRERLPDCEFSYVNLNSTL